MTIAIPGAKGSIILDDPQLNSKILFEMSHASDIQIYAGPPVQSDDPYRYSIDLRSNGLNVHSMHLEKSHLVIQSYEKGISHKVRLVDPTHMVFASQAHLPLADNFKDGCIVVVDFNRANWINFISLACPGNCLTAYVYDNHVSFQIINLNSSKRKIASLTIPRNRSNNF